MKGGILLDSSTWICYLRPRGWKALKRTIQKAFSEESVYTCWVVKAELLTGARDQRSFERLLADLRSMPEIPTTERVWEGASRLGYSLRRKGISLGLPDLLIAQAAIEGDLVLWHVDEHFEQIRLFSSLRTKSFLREGQANPSPELRQ